MRLLSPGMGAPPRHMPKTRRTVIVTKRLSGPLWRQQRQQTTDRRQGEQVLRQPQQPGVGRCLEAVPVHGHDEADVAIFALILEPRQSLAVPDHEPDALNVYGPPERVPGEVGQTARPLSKTPHLVVIGYMAGGMNCSDQGGEAPPIQLVPPAKVVESQIHW